MPKISPQQLLAELNEAQRTMPSYESFDEGGDDVCIWSGKVRVLIGMVGDMATRVSFISALDNMTSGWMNDYGNLRKIKTILHQTTYELQLQTIGPLNIAIDASKPYEYFETLRKEIEKARSDLLFIDPYIDHIFVEYYLPYVIKGVRIRLLTSDKKIKQLIPAIKLLNQQTEISVEVKTDNNFHDRCMFVDQKSCYQSGASFKDGAKKSPTTIMQITDAFDAMLAGLFIKSTKPLDPQRIM